MVGLDRSSRRGLYNSSLRTSKPSAERSRRRGALAPPKTTLAVVLPSRASGPRVRHVLQSPQLHTRRDKSRGDAQDVFPHESEPRPFPYSTSDTLDKLFCRYEKTQRAQNVSFRKLVHWIKIGERATHYAHSYPAKLLPHIAHFFLASAQLSSPGDVVLDPFGGTGTVALEAILAGRQAYLAEVNPLAALIAQVKTSALDERELTATAARINRRRVAHSSKRLPFPNVVNIRLWYSDDAIKALSALKAAIRQEPAGQVRDFFWVCFSQTCRKASNADPRLSVPVRTKHPAELGIAKVWNLFDAQVTSNVARIRDFSILLGEGRRERKAFCVGSDARALLSPKDLSEVRPPLPSSSVPLVITSPPYAGAQKYVRATSLSLGWLDLIEIKALKRLEDATIGREHFRKVACQTCPTVGLPDADRVIKRVFRINPLRSVIIATYLTEMKEALVEMTRVLRPGGHIVMVIGNNEVCKRPFKSSDYLRSFCEQLGLITRLRLVDEIRSRGLMTKRNRTASVITREWVLVFQKPPEDEAQSTAA